MSVYVLCVNSIMFILSICSIPLTLCFVFVFILFSVLPYGEIKLCNVLLSNISLFDFVYLVYLVLFLGNSALKWRDLKTGRRGRSRSLKMAPFDR